MPIAAALGETLVDLNALDEVALSTSGDSDSRLRRRSRTSTRNSL